MNPIFILTAVLVALATPTKAEERPFWEWFSHSLDTSVPHPTGGPPTAGDGTTQSSTSEADVDLSISNGNAKATASATHTGNGLNSASVSVGPNSSSASASASGSSGSASVHGSVSAHAGGMQ